MGVITMSGFIRVRAADGVRHEFHAPKAWVDAHPEFYDVLDAEPVSKPEPVKYVKTKRAAKSVAAVEPVDVHSAVVAPDAGVQSKENP